MIEKTLPSDVIYREVQQFRQTLLWISLLPPSLLLAVLFGYGMFRRLLIGSQQPEMLVQAIDTAITYKQQQNQKGKVQ